MPVFRPSPDSSLARHAARGIAWSALESLGSSGVSFVVSVVMAAFLAPREFGLIAMLQVFISLAQVCVDSGMTQALIRLPRRSREIDSTALIVNLLMGVGCYLLLWIAAPWVADFYSEPRLTAVMRVVCLAVPINALCVVQTARLTAAMDFRRLFRVTGVAVVFSGALGIFLAYRGLGVWALVWQQVSLWSVRAILLWISGHWWPALRFSKGAVKQLFGFSWKVMASALLNTVWENLYAVIIGKVFTPRATGLFWRANTFGGLPATTATGVITRVAYPLMGRVQESPKRMNVVFLRMLGMSAWIIFPCMMLMSILAEPLFATLFNKEWMGAVPMFRVLCVAMMFYPVHSLNLQILNAVGRSDLFLRLEVIKKAMTVCMLCITVPLGVEAICIGILIVSLLSLPVNAWYSGRYACAGLPAQVLTLLPVVLLSIAVSLAGFCVSRLFASPPVAVCTGFFSGVGLYIIVSQLLALPWWERLKHFRI